MPILQPYIKKLSPLEGLLILPPLALLISIGLFPAYGFRPEYLPLALFAVAYTGYQTPLLVKVLTHKGVDAEESAILRSGIFCVALLAALSVALVFYPRRDVALLNGPQMLTLRDANRQVTLTLRIYGQNRADGEQLPVNGSQAAIGAPGARPVILLVPPATGSMPQVDLLGDRLRASGFTVLSFAREGFDSPWVSQAGKWRGLPLSALFLRMRIYQRGMRFLANNEKGRELEASRAADIDFLLTYISYHRGIPGFSSNEANFGEIFILGCYSGGAAALLLAGNQDFISRFPEVKGLVLIESPVLSALAGAEPALWDDSAERAGIVRVFRRFTRWIGSLQPERIAGIGALPVPDIPLCIILSDLSQQAKHREGRYDTLYRIFAATPQPALLSSMAGAGILDFTDVPGKYPLYSFFFPSNGRLAHRPAHSDRLEAIQSNLAALILNFAATLQDQRAAEPEDESHWHHDAPKAAPLEGHALQEGVYHIEMNRAWNSLANKYIL